MDQITVNILIFLSGLVLGHWLTIIRDRRKEFNEVARPIRETIFEQLRTENPNSESVSAMQAADIRARLPWWKRKSFDAAWNSYQDEIKNTKLVQIFMVYASPKDAVAAMNNLLSFTNLR